MPGSVPLLRTCVSASHEMGLADSGLWQSKASVKKATRMLAVCLAIWRVLVSAGHQPHGAWLEACCCRSSSHEGRSTHFPSAERTSKTDAVHE